MLTLSGDVWMLEMKEDGCDVVLEDCERSTRWRLDESTRLVYRDADRQKYWEAPAGRLLGKGKAQSVGENTILSVHDTAYGRATLRWVMERDRLRVIAETAERDGINALNLPGAFRPEDEATFLTAIPNGQGILHTGRGPAFCRCYISTGTWGFTLAMFGQLARRGALLTVTETDADAILHWEKMDTGEIQVMWRQMSSMGRLSYPRETVFFPAEPNLTALCKRYRRYEIEKGRFRNWDEKIAGRPALARLFGSAIVFIGYWQDTELDYAASFRGLKAAGIDQALVYPVYMSTSVDVGAKLKGSWIDERRLLPLLRELGYLAGSFVYLMDGPAGSGEDAWRDLQLDSAGKPMVNWEMNGLQWYSLSLEKRFALVRELFDREHQGLDGIHYDTLTSPMPGVEDYHPRHSSDVRADTANRRAMLTYAAAKGLVVSSEGFWGRMTSDYDLGNTKYAYALGGDEYCVVPMTMLVYHDSAYHTWWEIDNYNNPEQRSYGGRGYASRFPWGGGMPRLQAAMDALMGTPPDIFPFGMQYNFIPHTKELYFYRYRLEDPVVQDAIVWAKPVMALNARIGKQEMVEHRLHRPDGALQETVFADGTRVVANFANVRLEAPDVGLLSAESWRMIG